MTQVLHLTNGKTIQEKIEAKKGRVARFVESKAPVAEIIDTVYLAALSRHPNPAEIDHLTPILEGTDPSEKRQVIEDLFWSVLTSREFLFQH